MFGPGTLDSAMKRRSIYFQIKRSQLPPMMIAFDGPDTLQSMGLRSSTTVAPQSLLLMNNALVRDAAKAWAKQLGLTTDTRQAVEQAYKEALGRPPTEGEIHVAFSFLRAQGKPRRWRLLGASPRRFLPDALWLKRIPLRQLRR